MADSKIGALSDDEWRRICQYLGRGLYLPLACAHPSLGARYANSFTSGGTLTSLQGLVTHGSVALVQWATAQGAPTDDIHDWGAWAAKCGNRDVLEWWYGVRGGIGWVAYTSAAGRGDVDMLRWCLERGGGEVDLPLSACHAAAGGGHLAALKWAHEHRCPLTRASLLKAAQGGHLEVCRWLRANGCECTFDETVVAAAHNNHLHILQWAEGAWADRLTARAWADITRVAAREGRLGLAEWAHTAGFRVFNNVHGPALPQLPEHVAAESSGYMLGAAEAGNIDMLEWARGRGYAWGRDVPLRCAASHRLEALRWLVGQGCPWDPQRCLKAAERCRGDDKEAVCEWIRAAAAGGAADGDAADGGALLPAA